MLKNYFDKVRRHFRFSRKEWIGFFVTIIVFALIASFDKWGAAEFDANVGLINLLYALIIVGSGIFIHHAGQKLYGLHIGLLAEHKIWWYGVLFSLLFATISNGRLQLYLAAGVFITQIPIHRIGIFRYVPGIKDWANVALAGPLANILFAGTIQLLQQTFNIFNPAFAEQVFLFNAWFAVCCMFPIPPLDGSRVFFAYREAYLFLFSAIVSFAVTFALMGLNFIGAAILSLIIGAVVWFFMKKVFS